MSIVVRVALLLAVGMTGLWSQQSGMATGALLAGVVMMEDGSPVPGTVDIKISCNGSERTVTRTLVTDDFEFQWSRPSPMGQPTGVSNLANPVTGANSDASSVVHAGIHDLTDNCDLRAWLPGYISSEISLSNSAGFDGANVGVLWLRPINVHQGNIVSALTLRAPREARKLFDKGMDLLHSGKIPAAANSFQKAVTIYPQYADAWLSLGRAQFEMGANDSARVSLQRAVELDPKVPGAWQTLGYIAFNEKKWEDAADYLGHAEQLDPLNSPTPWFYSAVAYYELRRYDRAEKSIRTEIDMDPQFQNHRARYVYGLILIARHDVGEGSDALRSYLATSPDPRDIGSANTVLSRLQYGAAK